VSNSGSWSARASGHPEVCARNLTFAVSSNWDAGQLSVATASKLPWIQPVDLIGMQKDAKPRIAGPPERAVRLGTACGRSAPYPSLC
jgi:hypothetical protein